jgi:ubiquinone/menaquinone biosynthesis C-methylase UbiE
MPSWFPDEVSLAGSEHLDPTYVATYAEKAGFDPTADLEELQRLGLNETSTLVDLGAGPGQFAMAAAQIARRVLAVDVSPAMLTRLRTRAGEPGAGHVERVQAGFLTYEHSGDPADFVYSRHALHHLPDTWKAVALRRIAKVLRPGGILHMRDITFSCELDELDGVVNAWLTRAAPIPDRGWTRAELETHLKEEFSTFSWLLEPMILHAGFDIMDVRHEPSRLYSTFVCVRR